MISGTLTVQEASVQKRDGYTLAAEEMAALANVGVGWAACRFGAAYERQHGRTVMNPAPVAGIATPVATAIALAGRAVVAGEQVARGQERSHVRFPICLQKKPCFG